MRRTSNTLAHWFAQDRWIPWTFVAGFLVVFAVNAVMVRIAVSSFSGLTTRSPYERGIGYNRVIEEAERQAALGWRIEIGFVSAGRGSRAGRLEIVAGDAHGAALNGAQIRAVFTRPVERVEAVELPVPMVGGGRYEAPLNLPLPGQWDLHVTIQRGGERLQLQRRVLAP
jgi:nitrogen fixation protein FixH